MARFAILDSNDVVVNVIEWSGNTDEWQPDAGYTTINIDNEPTIHQGHRLVNGSFVWQPSEEQIAKRWSEVRRSRDELLKNSDVLVYPDRWETYTTEQKTDISNYRQALRDLPSNFSDPFNIDWPVL